MTARIRSMLFPAFLALPFQMRQCNCSTPATIAAFAAPQCRIIGREAAGDVLQMLQPHADGNPVERRQLDDAGIGENASKDTAPVGEGGPYGAFGLADGVEAPADQHFDVRVGSCDGAENLADIRFRFDIAGPHFQVTFCVFATPDEGGIQGGFIATATVSRLSAAPS